MHTTTTFKALGSVFRCWVSIARSNSDLVKFEPVSSALPYCHVASWSIHPGPPRAIRDSSSVGRSRRRLSGVSSMTMGSPTMSIDLMRVSTQEETSPRYE